MDFRLRCEKPSRSSRSHQSRPSSPYSFPWYSTLEHSICIGAWDIRGDQRSRVFRVTDQLQGVPMLYRLSVGVHLVNIDTGNSCILRVIVEQIQKVHMRPHVLANRDDATA